jgi:DnaK suppressor protein
MAKAEKNIKKPVRKLVKKKPIKKAVRKPLKKPIKKKTKAKPAKKLLKKVKVKVKVKAPKKKPVKVAKKKQIKKIAKKPVKKVVKKPVKKPIKKVIKKAVVKPVKKQPIQLEVKVVAGTPSKPKVAAYTGPAEVKPYKAMAGEAFMNEQQLEHFRNILLLWKQQLVEDMGRTVQHMQDEAANYPDPIDRASQEEGFNLELRARDRELKLIRKIDEALERIQDGSYGYCEDCGAEIGIQRLEARPTATQCIECKTISEIREKQISG